MTESTPIVDVWLPHDEGYPPDCRIPIQSIRVRIPRRRQALRFKKREEGLQDYKGLPWSVYFRRRKEGFLISLQ